MTAITYTAKRNIEPTGVAVIAQSDIQANIAGSPQVSTFDSTDSPATDLSVFTDTRYIKSEGFTNTENNGWFGIDGVPTLQNITLDTNAVFVTEAAGNDITLTEYYRGSGLPYQIETASQFQTTLSDTGIRTTTQSLDGTRETLYLREEFTHDIATGVIEITELPQWREFFASVMGGELFTIDLYGSIATPNDPFSAYLEGNPTYTRLGYLNKYRINFRARKL